ncbi:MAG: alpha-glucuronidase [Bacteroidaceae bacterium]|nr:alpha-glucuronidase [Bacteroidaceae bacterium]
MKVKRLTILFVAVFAIAAHSCAGGRPENNDGHDLWLGDISKPFQEICQTRLLETDEELGSEGFRIVFTKGKPVIEANTGAGIMYGTYHLQRLEKCGSMPKGNSTIVEVPAFQYRVLNHWDNPNGTVERGFAGKSLWKWNEINVQEIAANSAVYAEYARANASVGINGTVLNNVNADPCMLTDEYLQKVKVLADIFRPYNLKVYLSLNFAAPKHLAGLKTSDPLDPEVIKWWNEKVAEIYGMIPDFGGFLVKANSEGQSGPQDYGRTHADGANMIADALKPYGGIVMWRAFVYQSTSPDRANTAVEEFMPLDGQFRDNVIIQIKNGPIDFQPREPFSPLFGQLEHTQVMAEMQITQEYLGHSNHLVYLHPMWKECLDSDTYMKGEGSTVAAITGGRVMPYRYTAIAGVANIGDSVNWCGHHFAQANWYAFGRMAWNPELTSRQIADEWLRQTFAQNDRKFIEPVTDMMLMSRETCVKYEMPLGIHHAFSGAGHYGPGPWDRSSRPDWEPRYYHKAGADGMGFDRTVASGSGNTAQYHEPLASQLENVETCPENLILWFHHLPWDYTMKSGRTLWDELCLTYQAGIDEARSFIDIWKSVEKYVDPYRFRQVAVKLERQAKDAIWWRDAEIGYFQTFSNRPLPEGCQPFQHPVDELQKFRLRISNYETPALDKLPEYTLD